MTITEFNEKLMGRFTEQITDLVFQFIESDRELMSDYLHTVDVSDFSTVNSHIAQSLGSYYGLESTGDVCDSPVSKLVQEYSVYRRPERD